MCFNIEWAWSKIFEFSKFDDGILEQVAYSMPSAKQQPSNIKHDVGTQFIILLDNIHLILQFTILIYGRKEIAFL